MSEGKSRRNVSKMFSVFCEAIGQTPFNREADSARGATNVHCADRGIILDPLAVSGTAMLAAKNTGREYIGVKKEKAYWSIAVARLMA